MPEYTVTFQMQMDAANPRQAAQSVADVLSDTDREYDVYAQRGVYEVTGPDGVTHTIDLSENFE